MRKESEVTKLVNIFLDGLVSVGNDAGWEGDSVLAIIEMFGGQVPRCAPGDQSNAAMIKAMRVYKNKHHEFARVNSVIQRLVHLNKTTRRNIMALLVKHYYHGINLRTDRVYSEDDKIALWIEHLNRGHWSDTELIGSNSEQVRGSYRYGVARGGPRLMRKELL